jgi:hypothetical protein
MDELGHEFFVFVNAENERLAILYRRRDGDLGLIEPVVAGEYTTGRNGSGWARSREGRSAQAGSAEGRSDHARSGQARR